MSSQKSFDPLTMPELYRNTDIERRDTIKDDFSLEMVKSGLKKTKKATSTEAKAASKEKNERET